MQNNSNDNSPGWKQRLNEFEDVTHNNLDVDAAWNRLQQRKHVTDKTKKPWYWLAAACLLLVVFLAVQQINDHTTIEKETGTAKTTEPGAAADNKMPVINNAPIIIEIENPEIRELIKPTTIKDRPVMPTKIKDSQDLMVMREEKPIPAIIGIDSLALPSVPVVATVKKMKVVHINEISQPGNTGIALQEGKPYFPVNYKSKQEYSNNSGNSARSKDNLIRIRLN